MESRWRNLLGLSQEECTELLDDIDRSQREIDPDQGKDPRDKRRSRRWRYRSKFSRLHVEHPDGGEGWFLVLPRNLSSGGVACVHGGFLHPGSRCDITIQKRTGEPSVLSGWVAHCEHVRGAAHNLGIRFQSQIDPTEYVTYSGDADDRFSISDLPDLRGRIVWLEEDLPHQSLIRHYLARTNVDITFPKDLGSMFDRVKKMSVDIVVTELSFCKTDAATIITRLRDEVDFHGPLILATAETRSLEVKVAMAAGASKLLEKPIAKDEFLKLLAEVHQEAGLTADSDSLRSMFEGDSDLAELIRGFVRQANEIGKQIEMAMVKGDIDGIRKQCLSVRGSASGFGFHLMADVATGALKSLDATMSVSESRANLTKLCFMCRGLRAP